MEGFDDGVGLLGAAAAVALGAVGPYASSESSSSRSISSVLLRVCFGSGESAPWPSGVRFLFVRCGGICGPIEDMMKALCLHAERVGSFEAWACGSSFGWVVLIVNKSSQWESGEVDARSRANLRCDVTLKIHHGTVSMRYLRYLPPT